MQLLNAVAGFRAHAIEAVRSVTFSHFSFGPNEDIASTIAANLENDAFCCPDIREVCSTSTDR